MEKEIMETVLEEILHELNDQKTQLSSLQMGMEKQATLIANMTSKTILDANSPLPAVLSEEQLSALKGTVEKDFEALRQELLKRPLTSNSFKHISLLPSSFRMEHFPLLVNTIMKWVIALIALIFAIRMIDRVTE